MEDINFRSTKIRTFDQALVTVPNSTLAQEAVTNWSKMGKRQISFNLKIGFKTTRDQLENCVKSIRSMLENHPDVHKETIFINFDGFGDRGFELFFYFFTITTVWGEFLEVKEDINFRIMEIIEKEGIRYVLPSRSIYFEKPVHRDNS